MDKPEELLAAELERILEGLDPLSQMLMIAKALREVQGGEWQVRTLDGGGYVIERVAS